MKLRVTAALSAASLISLASPAMSSAFTPLDGPSATTYQIDVAHTGTTSFDPPLSMERPFGRVWRREFAGTVSYPLIADGRVFAVYTDPNRFQSAIVALDAADGTTLWGPVPLGAKDSISSIAYDDGRVFAIDNDGLVQALDASDGSLDWSALAEGQYSFSSPPTATNGHVYISGAGSAGTVYAFDETNGAIDWTNFVENGDNSSPAFEDGNVYVSYVCVQAYSFDGATGFQHWHHSGDCEGGGGATAVVRDGRLWVRDWASTMQGYVLDASNGDVQGRFDASRIPAIGASSGYFLQDGTLRRLDLSTLDVAWSFAGNGDLITAPIVVDDTVLIGASSGMLYALDAASGHVEWRTDVGASIDNTYENSMLLVGLQAGDGLVLVPAGNQLVAFATLPDEIFADGFDPN